MQSQQQKEQRLAQLITNLYESDNGNRIRQIVRIVANAYEGNPMSLRRYFNSEDMLVVGRRYVSCRQKIC